MNNARIIREGISQLGFEVYGGVNAPYIWLKTPAGSAHGSSSTSCCKSEHRRYARRWFRQSGEGYFRLQHSAAWRIQKERLSDSQD